MAQADPGGADDILKVRDLSVHFATDKGANRAVDHVSLVVKRGETLAIVGESGSGKSALSRAIMRLLPTPPAIYAGGEVIFEGQDLLKMGDTALRRLRGQDIAMIFQEPALSLNPLMRVGTQIAEALQAHRTVSRGEARAKAVALLAEVGIADAPRRHEQYPHELSGGMRQRVMIAMALACEPRLLIADEPTTALDVTIQAQVLHLIDRLKRDKGMSVLLVTHNFGVVNQVADRVVVMYAGAVVETAPKRAILAAPRHPYSKGLLASVPRLHGQEGRIQAIAGTMASGTALPSGCRFHPRCDACMAICKREEPPLVDHGDGHWSKCWLGATVPAGEVDA